MALVNAVLRLSVAWLRHLSLTTGAPGFGRDADDPFVRSLKRAGTGMG